MNNLVLEGATRVLMISIDDSSALSIAPALPAAGMLIVMDADPERGAAIRRSFADAGVTDRASVIIGDPARMLYKIAGPFDVIVCDLTGSTSEPLRAALTKLLAPVGRSTQRMLIVALVIAALATASAVFVGRYWISAVAGLTEAARRLGSGDLATSIPVA